MAFCQRLALPLALSLAGHVALVFLLGLLRADASPITHPARSPAPSLSLGMASPMPGPTRRVPLPFLPDEKEWMDAGVEPVMKTTPTPRSTAAEPSLGPTLQPGGGNATRAKPGAGNEGATGTGFPVGSRFVVIPPRTQRVLFLMDRSLSMGLSDALDRARVELTAALRGLSPATEFQVLAYNQAAWPLLPTSSGWLLADRDHVARMIHQLDALAASGITRHVEAVKTGLRLQPDLLILFTDADDLSPGDVRLMSNANQGRAVIDVVELTRDPRQQADSSLALLAALNGGQHRRLILKSQ